MVHTFEKMTKYKEQMPRTTRIAVDADAAICCMPLLLLQIQQERERMRETGSAMMRNLVEKY